MKKPDPVTGLVIQYDYLWADRHRDGRTEGDKPRPCLIVSSRRNATADKLFVSLAAITHSRPETSSGAIPIPPRVAHNLGLDQRQSWLRIDELNQVTWSDAGFFKASETKWEYGLIEFAFWREAHQRVMDRFKEGEIKVVRRDGERQPDSPLDRAKKLTSKPRPLDKNKDHERG